MEQEKYDVFISYSRKDYVKDDVEIPGNPITAIMDCFDQNNVSYWIDKKGIYHGQAFVEVIADAIAISKMLVYVSSVHSNESIYTAGEILEALDSKKLIIPVRIDDCPYSKKFRIPLRPFDFIDYKAQPNTALPELLRTVNKEKERIRLIEEKQNEALLMEQKKQEISADVKKFQRLNGEQDFLQRSLYSKSKDVGAKTKKCPVCDSEMPVDVPYCESCGWRFASLYGVYGVDGKSLHDEKQLRIVRGLWHNLNEGKISKSRLNEIDAILEDERKKHEEEKLAKDKTIEKLRASEQKLSKENVELKESFDKISGECKRHIETIEQKKHEIMTYQHDKDLWKKDAEKAKQVLSIQLQESQNKTLKLEKEKIIIQERNNILESELAKTKMALNKIEESNKRIQKDYDSALAKIEELEEKFSSSHEQVEPNDIYDIILQSAGNQKLAVVKLVKDLTGLGLKEAKDLVDSTPNVTLASGVDLSTAVSFIQEFREIGAVVEMRHNNSSKQSPKKSPNGNSYSVFLHSSGNQKLTVVKMVKDLTGIGLKEAKDLVDSAPYAVLASGVDQRTATKYQQELEKAGAIVFVSETH